MLTSKQYVSLRGFRCPVCERQDVRSKKVLVLGKHSASQEMVCMFCSATWEEYYILAGIANVRRGE